MPFDLSDDTGADKPVSIDLPTGPTGRASDVFRKDAPSPSGAGSPGGKLPGSPSPGGFFFQSSERPEIPGDGLVKTIYGIAIFAFIVGVGYLMWGIWSGMLAEPNFLHQYAHADRLRIVENLTKIENVVLGALIVMVVAVLYLFYDEEAAGYSLVAIALLLDFVLPFLSSFFLGMNKSTPEPKTTVQVLDFLKALTFLPGIPGILLTTWDLVRRLVNGLYQAQVRRAGLRYGQNVAKQAVAGKKRNQFLGFCYNMPYCRESIRSKCPVYIKKTAPCWRYKMGCMCEETIAVLASAGDYKTAVATAMAKLEGRPLPHTGNPLLGMTAKIDLSKAEKAQRCRECVIYNTHQEQKYKLLAAVVFVVVFGGLFVFNGPLVDLVANLFNQFNAILGHFSLAAGGGQGIFTVDPSNSTTVAWFVLAFLSIVVLSKLLQLVEYFCFTLKI